MPLHIQLITPEKVLIDQEADEVVLPTTTGELAILPHHVPLVTKVAPGIMILKHDGKEETLAVDGGFVEITDKSVSVLADFAVHAREASAVKAEEARKAAEKAMKEKKSEYDFVEAEAAFRRALLELRLTNKNRPH